MGNLLSGWHFWVILLVIILLFGAPKLPGLAKSLGESMRIFRKEVKNLNEDEPTKGDSAADSASAASDSDKAGSDKPSS